jgi:uncharacterized repeat protein (TIGR03843 family)
VTSGAPDRQPSERRTDGTDAERPRDDAEALALLERGTLEVLGLLPRASNFTFLARVRADQDQMLAVYKPRSGEAPLWDFEEGTLAAREVAAYVVSDALGWPWVPPTVLREGPQGTGSVQRFVAFDPSQHYLTMQSERADEFRKIALFDLVANNADRKSGHCLLAQDGRIFVVDHGVCFHVEPKLRTVIWDFVDEPIAKDLLEDLRGLGSNLASGPFRDRLETLLMPAEIDAIGHRVADLLRSGRFPEPGPGRPYPWPVV